MDRALQLLKDLIAVDSINPSLVPGAAGEAAVARTIAEAMRGMGLTVETQDAAPGRPNVVGTLAGPRRRAIADVLRPHRHRRRRRHEGAVRSRRARRKDLRPRLPGHEERRGGDDRRGPRHRRIRRARRRQARDRVRRRRGARQHRRRCAGHAAGAPMPRSSPSPPICRWRSRTRDSSGSRSRPKASPPTAAARAKAATRSG